MHQQVANGDVVPALASEGGQRAHHWVVHVQLAAIDEHHGGGSGRDHLRERRHVVHRSLGVDRSSRRPIEGTVATLPDNGTVPPDDDSAAGESASRDAAAHDLIDHRQA